MGPGKMPGYSNDCFRNKMIFGSDSVWKEAYKRKIGQKKLCLTLGDPMDCSTPGFSTLHNLPELAQTHVR